MHVRHGLNLALLLTPWTTSETHSPPQTKEPACRLRVGYLPNFRKWQVIQRLFRARSTTSQSQRQRVDSGDVVRRHAQAALTTELA